MKAMILAAGLGKRMRPLTDHVPKPLLKVGDKCLIEFHLEKLAKAGIRDVVINTHWLAPQIPAHLGNGSQWGLRLHYSHEPDLLETAGGIVQALPLLTDDADPIFLLVNGDIYSELDFDKFLQNVPIFDGGYHAHLALVDNPEHNQQGDFVLTSEGRLANELEQGKSLTYAGLALFHRDFFKDIKPGRSLLGPLLKSGIEAQDVSGEHMSDYWLDVGTPERLQALDSRIQKQNRQKGDATIS